MLTALINGQGLTREKARETIKEIHEQANEIICSGDKDSYYQLEVLLADYGMEPDYIDQLLCF